MTMAAAETRRQEREIPSRSREKFESSLGRRDGVAEVTETTNLALYTPPGRRRAKSTRVSMTRREEADISFQSTPQASLEGS
jgi:hypothetical protein